MCSNYYLIILNFPRETRCVLLVLVTFSILWPTKYHKLHFSPSRGILHILAQGNFREINLHIGYKAYGLVFFFCTKLLRGNNLTFIYDLMMQLQTILNHTSLVVKGGKWRRKSLKRAARQDVPFVARGEFNRERIKLPRDKKQLVTQSPWEARVPGLRN